MKKKWLLLIVPTFIVICIAVIGIYLWINKAATTIIIDINPSIEIQLNKKNEVIRVNALNEDAKKIVLKIKDKSLDKTITNIYENIRKEYEPDSIDLIYHTEGLLKSKTIKEKLEKNLKDEIPLNIIEIKNITNEDKKTAKKYNISIAKAAYINSILKEYKSIPIENIIASSIKELNDVKKEGKYCKEGYMLEGDLCLKEKERRKPIEGNVCPDKYIDYNGTCYQEGPILEKDNKICPNGTEELNDDECLRKLITNVEIKCEEGSSIEYDHVKCRKEVPYADGVEYCRITPESDMLIDHKCYGPKPMINGGCLGSDSIVNGYCIDFNSYYEAEYRCPDGFLMSQEDAARTNYKCVTTEYTDPIEVKCPKNTRKDGNLCIEEIKQKKQKERYCSDGYTLIEGDSCINLNNQTGYINGLVCDEKDSKIINNECIIYEIIDAEYDKK